MKLDSKNSDNMNTSSKRDKSVDKKEKLKLDKEKKEREKQEKKERELIEKQKKEQEKNLKKSGQQNVSSSATSSDLNKLTKQTSKEVETSKSTGLSSSKSENVLNILKKPTMSIFGSSNNKKQPNNDKQQKLQSQSNLLLQQQQMIPKGRFRCQVVYLDESVKTFDLDKNAIGEDLMTMVANDLELYEKEYFSLTYRDINNMKFWIDHEKKIRSQLKGQISSQEPVFSFEVKFYPPEPNVLQEEITRYLLTLQLRHDIMDGKLPCTYVTHALLGSFTVQAEVGDYDEVTVNNARMNGLTGYEYLDGFCFAPNQTPELLAAIAECHKDHIGQTPAEAEMHFLENAVKLAMYGVDLHNAKDSDGVDILIGVSSSGLLVHRDHLRINRFAWPKILKISYKRNHFYLKLRSGEFEKYETTIGFRCPNHKSAKRLWKISVEHHAFFRLREPEPKKSTLIPNFNAKYRYTGSSTYMQARHRSIERSQPAFTRSLSKRLTQSMDRGLALQNPSDTPGSVQSAAFNHFNRMKQHVSIGNIPKQNTDFRESQEDLEEGDYDLNDDVNINIPNRNYQNQPYQQNKPINTQNPSIKYVNNNNLNQNQGANTLDKVIRDPTSSYRSTASYNQIPNQFNNNNNINNININNVNRIPNQNYNQNQQLEEYYTSVDKNFQNDENRMPSIKQSIGDTIATLSGMNKISTPLASPSPAQLQQSQRYVPARQISQEQNQNRGPTVSNRSVLNSTNLNTQSIPLVDSDNSDISVFDENSKSGNSNSNNKKSNPQYVDDKLPPKPVNQQLVNQQKAVNPASVVKQQINTLDSVKYEYNSREVTVKKNEDIRNILNKNFEKYEKNLNYLVDSDPNRGSSIRSGYNQPIQSQSPINSQRYQNQQIPTTNSSIRSMEQSYNPNSSQQQLPQPTVRARQQPPPIPADRSVINTRQNDSSRYQQILDQQFSDRQKPQISSSSAKQATSSATSFIKTNETSRSGSISSTPDVTRVKKLVLVNEEINHKDLLLRAIQMATDLDPNLEVEKVEISAED